MGENLRGRVSAARTRTGGDGAGADVAERQDPRATAAAKRDAEAQAGTRPIIEAIRKMESAYADAMPAGFEAATIVRDALTAVRTTPKLGLCDELSVLGALMTCAQLGLRVGVLGQAWVLPYWNERQRRHRAQFILGYQGLIELAYRSDRVTMLAARTVHERDEFDLAYGGPTDVFLHRPYRGQEGRGKPLQYYAQARTSNGGYMLTDPWTEAEMVAYRERFASTRGEEGQVIGVWLQHPIPMRHKTMVKVLGKFLPKSPELAHALAADESLRVDVSPRVMPGEASERVVPASTDIPGEFREDMPPEQGEEPPRQ